MESDEEIYNITFEADSADLKLVPGQSVGVLVPGPHEYGNKTHFRLYTIASTLEKGSNQKSTFQVCVRRCFYIDDFNGERYKGIASNYLCDLMQGEIVSLSGPYGSAFPLPQDVKTPIIMIGMGTGIAPFRAFVKRLYGEMGEWEGKVRLFYGARTGLELLYMNDEKNDFANYYDKETFEAFNAVSSKPHWDDPVALDYALEERAEEVWNMALDPKAHFYIAGTEKVRTSLDKAFAKMAGSQEAWELRKAELVAGKRWLEVIY